MKQLIFIFSLSLLVFSGGCKKDKSGPQTVSSGKITFNIHHKVGGNPLTLDTLAFVNEAGNTYNVEKLQYYLSGFRFFSNSTLEFSSSEIFYIDVANSASTTFSLTQLSGMPTGTFDSIAFFIGIDAAHNISYSLPSTPANIDMGWPDAMGGGYHFLKMEGHWVDGASISGYAMHLGSNNYQVKAGKKCSINVAQAADATVDLTMDINEWFRNPYVYNFTTDGVFTMGNAALMQKLTDNGADVFTGN